MQLWDGSRPGYRAANTARKSPCIVYWYFSTPLSHRSVQFRAHQVEGRRLQPGDCTVPRTGYRMASGTCVGDGKAGEKGS